MTSGLVVEDLALSFGGVRALDGVSFSWDSGILGVIGANGAGKTTLVNCITGAAAPTAGRIFLDDVELTGRTSYAVSRAGVRRTFQHPRLLGPCTVWENLLLGRDGQRRRASWRRLQTATPLGRIISPWMDADIVALPYGIRKVVDIARGAIGCERILVCDEPLSGLDEAARDLMQEILLSIAASGVQLLVVEHDVQRLLAVAARILAMERGRVVVDESPRQFYDDDDIRRRFIELA